MNRNVRLLVITLFIVGFPAVSWYYLNQGYNYRMAIIEELDQQLGEVPDFQMSNQFGQKVRQKDMANKAVIMNFADIPLIEKSKDYMDILYKIQDQFDKKDDILFYTFAKAESLAQLQTYTKNLNIKEEKQWHFLTVDNGTMEQFIQAFPMPEGAPDLYEGNPIVAIADTSSTIRHFYDLNDKKQAGKLVEHIANLMPQAPPEEARMKRELEK